MSKCISTRGEYSEHEPDDAHTCTYCFVLDEEALTAELRRFRAGVVALRDALRHGSRLAIEDAVDGLLALIDGK